MGKVVVAFEWNTGCDIITAIGTYSGYMGYILDNWESIRHNSADFSLKNTNKKAIIEMSEDEFREFLAGYFPRIEEVELSCGTEVPSFQGIRICSSEQLAILYDKTDGGLPIDKPEGDLFQYIDEELDDLVAENLSLLVEGVLENSEKYFC